MKYPESIRDRSDRRKVWAVTVKFETDANGDRALLYCGDIRLGSIVVDGGRATVAVDGGVTGILFGVQLEEQREDQHGH